MCGGSHAGQIDGALAAPRRRPTPLRWSGMCGQARSGRDQLPQPARAGRALQRLAPVRLGHPLVRRDRLVGAGDHRHAGTGRSGCVSVRNGLIARLARSRGAQDLERRAMARLRSAGRTAGPSARPPSARPCSPPRSTATSRQIRRTRSETWMPPATPVSSNALHRRQRHDGDDAGPPHRDTCACAPCRMPSTCSAIAAHRRALRRRLLGGLVERLGQRASIGVRRRQVADRPEQLQDLVGGLLDLADPLEIADRAGCSIRRRSRAATAARSSAARPAA